MSTETGKQGRNVKLPESMNGQAFLEMKGICKAYPGVQALSNVSIEVRAGEILSLVGENGAGKSTMMKVLAGAIRPDSGEIFIDGRRVTFSGAADAHARGISTIYQELMLIPHLSVLENIFLGTLKKTRFGTLDWNAMRKQASAIMANLGYSSSLDIAVEKLSIAEKQLVEIGKAMTRECRLLIMDEPTAPLNREEVDHFFKIVKLLQSAGTAIIFITHHLNEIFEICDRAIVLRDGQYVGESTISTLTESRLVEMMIGRKLNASKCDGKSRSTSDQEEILKVEGLSSADLLKNISFGLKRGEVLGLAGLMGSGRTEILRAVFGVEPLSSGRIVHSGKVAMFSGPKAALAHGVGLGPEDRKADGLVLSLPIRHNITMSSMRDYSGWLSIRRSAETTAVKRQCERLQVKYSSTESPVGSLSGGNQQKIILARLIEAQASILLLDEPTRGIDVGAKEAIFELIRELSLSGSSIIIVSSVIEELFRVCDRVLCLNLGRVTGELLRDDFDMSKIMINVMGGKNEATAERLGLP